MTIPACDPGTVRETWRQSRIWTGRFMASPAHLPLSFTYNGQESRNPGCWSPLTDTSRQDANMIRTQHAGTDPETGLQIRVETLEYRLPGCGVDRVAATNTGNAPTPMLRRNPGN